MADVRKLKDEAAKAVEKGRHRRAAELYVEVSAIEKDDPLWPHRAGEAYKRAGMATEAIRQLGVAAEGYVRQGFLLKAISVAKMILEIDPRRTETQAMLAGLYARREGGAPARPTTPGDRAPTISSVLPAARTIEPEPDAGDVLGAGGPRATPMVDLPPLAMAGDAIDLFDGEPVAAPPPIPRTPPSPEPTIPIVLALPDELQVEQSPSAARASQSGARPLPPPVPAPVSPILLEDAEPSPAARAPDPTIPIVLALPDELRDPSPSRAAPRPPADEDDWSSLDAAEPEPGLFESPAPVPAPDPTALLARSAEITLDGTQSFEAALSAGVDAMALNRVMPGAHISQEFEAFEIPIESPGPPPPPATPTLPRVPLFSSLDEDRLQRLIERSRLVRFAAGETIVRQGDVGSSLYVIVKGEVEVSIEGVGPPVNYLREGAFFGELAVLTEFRRMATVVALDEVELLEIGRDVIKELVGDSPEVMRVLLRFFRERLIDRLIATSPLFAPFSGEESRLLAEKFQFLEFEAGAVMIREGERSGGLFVILCGEAAVTTMESGQLAIIGAGEVAGEMSMLTRAPAMATVHARSRVWALALPRSTFQELILTHPQVLIFVNELAESRRQKVSERLSLF